MITILVIAALFALAVSAAAVFIYRMVSAVKLEDRTYADRPPKLLLVVWPLVTVLAFYLGNRLSVEYREQTIRRLRKAELDYALSPQQWFAARIVYAILIGGQLEERRHPGAGDDIWILLS
jgi:tight adherence protein C